MNYEVKECKECHFELPVEFFERDSNSSKRLDGRRAEFPPGSFIQMGGLFLGLLFVLLQKVLDGFFCKPIPSPFFRTSSVLRPKAVGWPRTVSLSGFQNENRQGVPVVPCQRQN